MEDGVNAGVRHIGVFALWCIPWVLGLAATVWLGFFLGARHAIREMKQEDRRAIYVGAAERPKSKLKIETPNDGPVKIDRVDLDGSVAAIYMHNSGYHNLEYQRAFWQLVSPDGTLMASGDHYLDSIGGPKELPPGAKAEVVFDDIKKDDRAASVRFWVR